jgi:hypothetical protein
MKDGERPMPETPMTPDAWTDRLSEYLDGELSPAERAALDRHLAGCAACRDALDALRRVVAAAGRIDDRPPVNADLLWSGIAARIGATPPQGVPAAPRDVASLAEHAERREATRRRFSFTLPQLAAAAVLLMVVSGGGAALLLQDDVSAGAGIVATIDSAHPSEAPAVDSPAILSPAAPELARIDAESTAASTAERERQAPAPRPRRATPSPRDAVPATAVADQPALRELSDYDAAVGELEELLDAERQRLDPKTVRVLERNLAIIDSAIAEARRAVEQDPENGYLRTYLNRTLRRKVELLRTASAIAAQS